jgi:hypothetical protein
VFFGGRYYARDGVYELQSEGSGKYDKIAHFTTAGGRIRGHDSIFCVGNGTLVLLSSEQDKYTRSGKASAVPLKWAKGEHPGCPGWSFRVDGIKHSIQCMCGITKSSIHNSYFQVKNTCGYFNCCFFCLKVRACVVYSKKVRNPSFSQQ